MVNARTCSNGHAVAEDYLKVCPRCGGALDRPDHEEKPPSLAPAPVEPIRVSRTVPFVAGGIVLGLFGWLLSYAAERGPAEVFGFVLIGAAVVIILVGLADAGRGRR